MLYEVVRVMMGMCLVNFISVHCLFDDKLVAFLIKVSYTTISSLHHYPNPTSRHLLSSVYSFQSNTTQDVFFPDMRKQVRRYIQLWKIWWSSDSCYCCSGHGPRSSGPEVRVLQRCDLKVWISHTHVWNPQWAKLRVLLSPTRPGYLVLALSSLALTNVEVHYCPRTW